MKRKKITDNTFCVPTMINRQLLTKENAKYLFPSLGKMIMSYIEREKLIIPKDDFIAYVHVKFIREKDIEEARRYEESD